MPDRMPRLEDVIEDSSLLFSRRVLLSLRGEEGEEEEEPTLAACCGWVDEDVVEGYAVYDEEEEDNDDDLAFGLACFSQGLYPPISTLSRLSSWLLFIALGR